MQVWFYKRAYNVLSNKSTTAIFFMIRDKFLIRNSIVVKEPQGILIIIVRSLLGFLVLLLWEIKQVNLASIYSLRRPPPSP